MTTEFYGETDWECSSGPILTRAFDASADLWPHGAGSEIAGGDKDVLADGLHPVLAIGPKAGRPHNLTGVVVTYNSLNDRAEMNLAEKVCVKAYVANVLTYANDVPATFEQAPVPFQPVYVDDSNDLSEGVTVSMSPLNDEDVPNPLAGYLYYCQDELADSSAGGARSASTFDSVLANSLVEQSYCILLTSATRDLA